MSRIIDEDRSGTLDFSEFARRLAVRESDKGIRDQWERLSGENKPGKRKNKIL